jgi:hypothetical protein
VIPGQSNSMANALRLNPSPPKAGM